MTLPICQGKSSVLRRRTPLPKPLRPISLVDRSKLYRTPGCKDIWHPRLLKRNLQGNTRNQYIKNYSFEFEFGPPWGHCNVVMTSVSGHLTEMKFDPEYEQDWNYPPPERLFEAPVRVVVDNVSHCGLYCLRISS